MRFTTRHVCSLVPDAQVVVTTTASMAVATGLEWGLSECHERTHAHVRVHCNIRSVKESTSPPTLTILQLERHRYCVIVPSSYFEGILNVITELLRIRVVGRIVESSNRWIPHVLITEQEVNDFKDEWKEVTSYLKEIDEIIRDLCPKEQWSELPDDLQEAIRKFAR
jgi:hypothetical protein